MDEQEKLPVKYKEVTSLALSDLSPEHPLVKWGFSPQLPARLKGLNDCLSHDIKFERDSDIWHSYGRSARDEELTQLESLTLELTPDPQHPRLVQEAQYNKRNKTYLTVFPDGGAMLKIFGAPSGQMPDPIGAVDFLDMQNFVRQIMPTGSYATLRHIDIERNVVDVFIDDFLSLKPEEFFSLEPKIYDLYINRAPIAHVVPYSGTRKCWINALVYGGKAQDVEKALVEFTELLERNPTSSSRLC